MTILGILTGIFFTSAAGGMVWFVIYLLHKRFLQRRWERGGQNT